MGGQRNWVGVPGRPLGTMLGGDRDTNATKLSSETRSVLCWAISFRSKQGAYSTGHDSFRGSLTFYPISDLVSTSSKVHQRAKSSSVYSIILLALGAAGRCSVVASDDCTSLSTQRFLASSSLAHHAPPLGLLYTVMLCLLRSRPGGRRSLSSTG